MKKTILLKVTIVLSAIFSVGQGRAQFLTCQDEASVEAEENFKSFEAIFEKSSPATFEDLRDSTGFYEWEGYFRLKGGDCFGRAGIGPDGRSALPLIAEILDRTESSLYRAPPNNWSPEERFVIGFDWTTQATDYSTWVAHIEVAKKGYNNNGYQIIGFLDPQSILTNFQVSDTANYYTLLGEMIQGRFPTIVHAHLKTVLRRCADQSVCNFVGYHQAEYPSVPPEERFQRDSTSQLTMFIFKNPTFNCHDRLEFLAPDSKVCGN